MNKALIYAGAFVLGLVSAGLGFYFLPVYKLPLQYRSLLGPKAVYWTYSFFALVPITIYYKLLLTDTWVRAALKGLATIAMNLIIMGLFILFARSTGKW